MPLNKIKLIGVWCAFGITILFCLSLMFPSGRKIFAQMPFIEKLVSTRKKVQRKAKINLINFYMPKSFEPFLEIAQGNPNTAFTSDYTNYFESIIDVFPTQSDAYLALAICRYYNQNTPQAIDLLQKSVLIDPNAFWSLYNLGLLLYKQQQYSQAAVILQKAISITPEQAMRSMIHSKVYQQIIQSKQPFPFDLTERLKNGYKNVFLLLKLVQNQIINTPQNPENNIKELQNLAGSLRPGLF